MKEALKRFLLVVIGVTVLLVAFILSWYILFRGKESTDDAQIDTHLVSVSARIPGTVMQVLVNDNQKVKAGELLVQLDPKDYKAKVAEAEAALILAQKNLQSALLNVPITNTSSAGNTDQAQASLSASLAEEKSAQDKISELHAAIRKSTADLEAAQSRLTLAKSNFDRTKLLAKNYVASQQQYDSAKTTYEDALASVAAAKATLEQSRIQLRQSESQLGAAKARVEQAKAMVFMSSNGPVQVRVRKQEVGAARAALLQAKANLRLARLQLSYTQIRAMEDGFVTNKNVTPGQVVAAGQQLLVLTPLKVWVTANFKETQLTHMKPGDKADITVDTYPGKVFHGRVDSISAATGSITSLFPPENATGNFVKVVQRIPVKIVLDPDTDKKMLRAGMSVEATVYVNK